ncbi:chemotaxis protein MotA [Hydrogenivirga caldilitoris]|uniref:Chemotaxis protein MotA n=1 Tax=Hydrogenivirga caldilitoris TaxID=246264 RepID=A0A497XW16_9AQUI|nr:MotA/TolQ/ExbB proton channel family protein [Hydrogenivirga caldilitoris]RLJ71352.1 chemotaxis protein MotA [Hydrogenivirga caldilitoris]
MDPGALIGIGGAFIMIVIAIVIGGSPAAFINIPSIFIVVGGGMAATMGGFPLKEFIRGVASIKDAFLWKPPDAMETVEFLSEIATKVRREGILALESEIELYYERDPLLGDMIRMLVDGLELEEIKISAEGAIAQLEDKLGTNVAVWERLGDLFPAFGMIGTLIGLIQMLKNLNDPSALGPGMAVALITTLYGAILANAFAIPIATKLKKVKNTEILFKTIYLMAIEGIQKGVNPNILRQELSIMLGLEVTEEV